jgi:hypothetical protein
MRPLRLKSTAFFQRRHATPLDRRLPPFVLDGFSPAQITLASRAWTMRAEEEHHSAAVFSDLLSLLLDADVPLDVLAHVTRIVADELRHTELCTELAQRMNASAPRSKPLPRGAFPHEPAARRARGLRIALVEGAIGETISSALFAAGRRVAEEPCTKAALGLVLRDEVLHARSFWEALDTLRADFDASDFDGLHEEARRALGLLEHETILPVLRRLERGEPFDPAWGALGVLPPADRVDAFYYAVEARVVPRLDELGLDGTTAWKDRYVKSA